MNYKLRTGAGDRFSDVAKKAKKIATERDCIVEFDFNEIKCLVSKDTVLDWMEMYYMDAHIMEWKQIGHDCHSDYDTDTKIELYTRRLERAKEEKRRRAEQKIKDDAEKDSVDKLTAGVEISIIEGKESEYAKYVENNIKDGYSRGVVDYAEAWAKLMQVEISKGRTVVDVADETQKPLGYLGITGFMYGCAVQALAHFWKHGEELRKWHNKQYGVSEDKKGTVNPAILTIG